MTLPPPSPEDLVHLQLAVENPIFIVGTMRSGTTFVGESLNSCPQIIGCPFELRKLWSQVGGVPMASDVIDRDCPCLDQSDVSPEQRENLEQAFKASMRVHRGDKLLSVRSRFLNKCPHLSNKIGLVHGLFEQAKFVWTVRNMRDVVGSLKEMFARPYFADIDCYHYWPDADATHQYRCWSVRRHAEFKDLDRDRLFPGGNIQYLAEYWLESNLSLARHFAQTHSDQRIAVRHADMLERPASVAASLESFLGLNRDDLTYLTQFSNNAKTQRWATRFSVDEKITLNEFEESNKAKFDEIQNSIMRASA